MNNHDRIFIATALGYYIRSTDPAESRSIAEYGSAFDILRDVDTQLAFKRGWDEAIDDAKKSDTAEVKCLIAELQRQVLAFRAAADRMEAILDAHNDEDDDEDDDPVSNLFPVTDLRRLTPDEKQRGLKLAEDFLHRIGWTATKVATAEEAIRKEAEEFLELNKGVDGLTVIDMQGAAPICYDIVRPFPINDDERVKMNELLMRGYKVSDVADIDHPMHSMVIAWRRNFEAASGSDLDKCARLLRIQPRKGDGAPDHPCETDEELRARLIARLEAGAPNPVMPKHDGDLG